MPAPVFPCEAAKLNDAVRVRGGLAWGLFSGVTWGLTGVVLGLALLRAPFAGGGVALAAPLAAAAMHDGLAALWLFLFNLFAGRRGEFGRVLASGPGRAVCLAAVFGGPVGMSGYLLAIRYAGAAYAIPVTALYPAVASVLAVFFLKERITARVWCGIALCVAGAAVIGYSPPAGGAFPRFYLGIAFALLATLGWGAEGVLSASAMKKIDPAVAVNIREAVSFVVYLVAVLPLAGALGVFRDVFGAESFRILLLAGFLGGLSFLSWYRGLSMAGVGRAMSLNVTYALWGVVFGAIFTDVDLTVSLVIGAVVITAGALLVVSRSAFDTA